MWPKYPVFSCAHTLMFLTNFVIFSVHIRTQIFMCMCVLMKSRAISTCARPSVRVHGHLTWDRGKDKSLRRVEWRQYIIKNSNVNVTTEIHDRVYDYRSLRTRQQRVLSLCTNTGWSTIDKYGFQYIFGIPPFGRNWCLIVKNHFNRNRTFLNYVLEYIFTSIIRSTLWSTITIVSVY